MRGVVVIDGALSAEEVDALKRGALHSPFFGDSPLRGTFEATRGFSVTFLRPALDELLSRFVFLRPFLQLAVDPRTHRQMRAGIFARIKTPPRPNAFYLNALVVPPSAGIERHIDATLSPSHDPSALKPVAVAVAYVQVPSDLQQGALVIDDGRGASQCIAPLEGRLVVFDGALAHAVQPVNASSARVSWVLEQYALDAAALANIPRLRINSRAGFAAYLIDARSRSAGVDAD